MTAMHPVLRDHECVAAVWARVHVYDGRVHALFLYIRSLLLQIGRSLLHVVLHVVMEQGALEAGLPSYLLQDALVILPVGGVFEAGDGSDQAARKCHECISDRCGNKPDGNPP